MKEFFMDRYILLIGIAVILGSIGGRIFARFRIPQVVGYIIMGILAIFVGGVWFHAISLADIQRLEPISLFALAIIGFSVGGELKKEVFQKHGRGFIIVLLFEGLTAALFVTILTGLVTCPWSKLTDASVIRVLAQGNWSLALLLGAIASATAPAATVDVLWEYKSRGILTTTVLAIVALDDGLALLLYGFASSVGDLLSGNTGFSLANALGKPLYDILGSVILGAIVGSVYAIVLRIFYNREIILPLCIGSLLSIIGLSHYLNLDHILAAMSSGVMLVNLAPRKSREAFDQLAQFAPPIFVLFFVLIGARLQPKAMAGWMIVLAVAYVVGRTGGKFLGAYFGSKLGGLPSTVRKYLGFCLFSQAGVAIGLAILATHRLPNATAQSIILVITATTFLVQIIGPPFVRFAVIKAGEAGKDLTEEDLLAASYVSEIMDSKPPVLKSDSSLEKVLQIAAESDSLFYPVVDEKSRVIGIISFLNIKNLFFMEGLENLVLASDLMTDVPAEIVPGARLTEALEKMQEMGMEALPVVSADEDRHLLGMIEQRKIRQTLGREIIRRNYCET
jgi:Kef-type K+ transport system membrane component KefB/predicted transcriptional regulator